MLSFKDPRVLAAAGSAAALLLALLVLAFCVARGRHAEAPAAGQHGALQVQVGKQDAKLDPAKPLRCFVGGQFIGELTLVDCANKNGVAAQNLDVGLDQTGQMAAAQSGQADLAPPPQPQADAPIPRPAAPVVTAPAEVDAPAERSAPVQVASASASGPAGQCLRFVGGEWRESAASVALRTCVHMLYDGRCVRPGDGLYGRFGGQTLRLVPGRVEISNDNRNFRTLVPQAQDCSLP